MCSGFIKDCVRNGEGFSDQLLSWYEDNGRSFYWREGELSAFEHLLTELLLKRTTAQAVHNHGNDIISTLNSPGQVLSMDHDALVDVLRPLGLYNRRAKNIRTVCEGIQENHCGEIPDSRQELLAIEGIGEYTADMVLSVVFQRPVVAIDTNVMEVAHRYFDIEKPADPRLDTEIRPTLEPIVPPDRPAEFNWALIDLGAALRGENAPSSLLTG